jgi:ribosomal protein S18 acetylase RimI-like enzyme
VSRESFPPPVPLGPKHDLSQFANGKHPVLDDWLRDRAGVGEGLSARTYVITTDDGRRVIGYYSISTASEQRQILPSAKLRRNMPDPIPLLLIGRLAVDHAFRGRGLGGDLLMDAVERCVAAAEIVGCRGVVTHAIDDEAVGFYEHYGFERCALGERAMLLPIEIARGLTKN